MSKNYKDIYEEVLIDIPYLYMISPAYIQRIYGVDYEIASQVIDNLYKDQLIGSVDGSKPRLVVRN